MSESKHERPSKPVEVSNRVPDAFVFRPTFQLQVAFIPAGKRVEIPLSTREPDPDNQYSCLNHLTVIAGPTTEGALDLIFVMKYTRAPGAKTEPGWSAFRQKRVTQWGCKNGTHILLPGVKRLVLVQKVLDYGAVIVFIDNHSAAEFFEQALDEQAVREIKRKEAVDFRKTLEPGEEQAPATTTAQRGSSNTDRYHDGDA